MNFLRKITTFWYFPWLIAGVILRLLVSPITAHPDLWALFISQNLFIFKRVFNIYDYLAYLPEDNLIAKNYGINFFTYPPLTYFLFGFFGLIFRPFLSLKNFEWILENYPYIYEKFKILLTIFLFKIPYLFFDLGIAFLLADLFSEFKKKKLVFILWMVNPLVIYTSFMMGQFDVIPLFFSLLSLWFILKRNQKNLGTLSLGIGGALKMYPFFFLPFLIILGKNFWEKLKLTFLGVFPYLLTISPFLSSPVFRQVSLFSSQSQKMLYMSLPVSGAEGIYIFVFLFFFLIFYAEYQKINFQNLWRYFLVVMLFLFSITHYHPQWFLWITPFLILELVENNFRYIWLVITLLVCWLFITLTFEASLSYGLFVPIFPHLQNAPSLADFINRWFNVFQLKSLVRSIFVGTALFYSWIILKEKDVKKS